MRNFWAFCAAIALSASGCFAEETKAPSTDTANLPWVYDFQLALDKAKEQKTLALVYLYASDNDKCKELERSVFTNPAVAEALRKVVPMRANFSDNTKLAYKLWLFGADTFAVVDPSGTVIARADVKDSIDTSEKLLDFLVKAEKSKAEADENSAKENSKKDGNKKADTKPADAQTSATAPPAPVADKATSASDQATSTPAAAVDSTTLSAPLPAADNVTSEPPKVG